MATTIKAVKKNLSPAENQKWIGNHKNIAALLETAAKHHLEAAKYLHEGKHKKANQSTIKAQSHFFIAIEEIDMPDLDYDWLFNSTKTLTSSNRSL